MTYGQSELPQTYYIREVLHSCAECGESFIVMYSMHDDLVKYIEPTSGEERWLPVFGKYGYLDLLERLVPGYSRDMEVTMPISRDFGGRFEKLQEPSSSGRPFSVAVRASCPRCGGIKLRTDREIALESPPIYWMRFRIDE